MLLIWGDSSIIRAIKLRKVYEPLLSLWSRLKRGFQVGGKGRLTYPTHFSQRGFQPFIHLWVRKLDWKVSLDSEMFLNDLNLKSPSAAYVLRRSWQSGPKCWAQLLARSRCLDLQAKVLHSDKRGFESLNSYHLLQGAFHLWTSQFPVKAPSTGVFKNNRLDLTQHLAGYGR